MKLLTRVFVVIIIVFALGLSRLYYTSAASTALGNLVASMQPGTWAQLPTNNINQTLSNTGGAAGSIFGYAEYIKWDSVGHRLYYMGSDHSNSSTQQNFARHVQYDEATNGWTILPQQDFGIFSPGNGAHGYDHGAIDPLHRYFYWRRYSDLTVYRYNMDTGVWTAMPQNNVIQFNSCCVGIDYFPELHGVMWAGDENGDNGGVTRLNDATGQWDRIGQAAAYPMGDLHNFAEYNPIFKVMVFGGGESGAPRKIYKLNASGVVTPLRDPPVDVGINSTIFTVDPVSGDYLVFTNTSQFYVYNVSTDTWTLRASGPSVPIWTTTYGNPIFGAVGGPIDTYGVNVFVTCDGPNNCRVNIYRHSSGGSTPPPTVSITAPANGLTVFGTIPVLANASSSSSSVAGVQFRLDGNNLGAQVTASPYSTSWNTTTASNGSHTLTAVATDTAGNQGTSASVTVTVNNSSSTFDFSLSTGGSQSATQGQAVLNTVTETLSSGTAQSVSFSASGLPAGASASFAPTSCVSTCTSTMTVSTLASTPTGSYLINVTGASDSLSHSASFTLTVNAAASSLSFTQKCLQPGVVKCVDFDDQNKLFYGWPGQNDFTSSSVCDNDPFLRTKTWNAISPDRSGPGNIYAIIQNGRCVYPMLDATMPHSGASSLKFTIPSNSDANSSGYFTDVFQRLSGGNFGYIGPNSPLGNVLYFQFYQMVDSNFLNTNYLCSDGTCTGWKQAIWYGNPPNGASSSSLESTMINGYLRGVPQMYGQQGTDDYGIQDTRGCGYNFNGQNTYPEPPCIRYKAGQWMEFTGRIEIRGASNAPTSRVQLWVDGQLAIDHGTAMLDWGSGMNHSGDGFGAFMLTPYHTRKDPSQSHPTGFTWYDDVIISTQPIAMGSSSGGTVDTTPPTVSITSPANGAMVSGTTYVYANASDNVGVVGVQFQLDGANLGAEVTVPPYWVLWNTTSSSNGSHILKAIARDAAGNRTTSAGLNVMVSNTTGSQPPPPYNPPPDNPPPSNPPSSPGSTPSTPPTTTYSLPDTGGQGWMTRTTASSLKTGFARVQPDSGTRTPSGIAIIGYRNGDVLVSEAGVPASPLIQSGRIFVDVNGPVNTGIALANPSNQDAMISFSFSDADGTVFGQDSFTLSANHQIAGFLTDSPFKLNHSSMTGTFSFTSSVSVSAIALRGFMNERGEFLMTTLPVVQLPNVSSGTATLAHFADGGGWDTQVILINPTESPLSGTLQFSGQGSGSQAAPLLTMTVNGVSRSVFDYQIPGRGAFRFSTQGAVSNAVQAGSVQITPASGQNTPSGLAIFSFRRGGVTVTQASVAALALGSAFRVYVEATAASGQSGAVQSGLAIANPSQTSTVVYIELVKIDGTPTTQPPFETVTVPPGGQIARFINEIFPVVPNPLQGILRVTATSPVAVTGLRGRYNERGDFLITTTPPTNEAQTPTSLDVLFPQVVTGGGYSTQFILFNGSPGINSGAFWITLQDGTLLPANSVLQ